MAKQKIIFGEWLPDQPGVTGAVMDAYNCYPISNGYGPLREAVDYSANAGQNLLVTFAGKFAGASASLLSFESYELELFTLPSV